MKLNMSFLHQAHHSPLPLKNTRQHFNTTPGDHFKQQNRPQKAQNAKNMASNRPQKAHLFTVWAETRGQSVFPFDLSGRCACRATQVFCCFPLVCKWPWKHYTYFGVTNKFWLVGGFANTEWVNNEGQLGFKAERMIFEQCLSRGDTRRRPR